MAQLLRDKAPIKNDFLFEYPEALYGSEIAIPSGKFWIAIPIDNVKADIIFTPIFPAKLEAKTIPNRHSALEYYEEL